MANEINAVAGQLWGVPVGQVYTAGKGIVIDNVHKTVRVDETVLWEDANGAIDTFSLSEATSNFERIRIHWNDWTSYKCEQVQEFGAGDRSVFTLLGGWAGANNTIGLFSIYLQADAARTTLTTQWTRYIALNNTSAVVTTSNERIIKIVGVNRISS